MIHPTIRLTSYSSRHILVIIARFRWTLFDTQVIEIDFASNELINTRHLP